MLRERDLELALELERVAAGQAEQRDLDVVAPRQRLQLGHRARGSADDEAARRLAEERGVEAQRRLGRIAGQRTPDAAEQAALRERDQQPAVGAVVGGLRAEPARAAARMSLPTARSRARSSAGGRPATMPCSTFRYSLPPRSLWLDPISRTKSPSLLEAGLQPVARSRRSADHADDRRRVDRRLRPADSLYRLTLPLTIGSSSARHACARPAIVSSSCQ